MSGSDLHIDWMVLLVQMTRALAWPLTVLVILYSLRSYIREFLGAAGQFIRERQFKIAGAGITFEAAGAVEEQVRSIQQEALPPPSPELEPSKIADRVEAHEFILRDEAGRARAVLGFADEEGEQYPSLRMFDSEGELALVMEAHEDGFSTVTLWTHGESSAGISTTPEDGPQLLLMKSGEKGCAIMKYDLLYLADVRVLLHAPKTGPSTMSLRDSEGRETVGLPSNSG